MDARQESSLIETVSAINERTIRIEEQCGPCQTKIEKCVTALDGNGMGLKTRMALAEDVINKSAKETQRATKWYRAQLGAFIAALLGCLAMAAKHFMEPH
jgi:hypothetical protein